MAASKYGDVGRPSLYEMKLLVFQEVEVSIDMLDMNFEY